uniref:Ovule protein n=1 Tax=Caenorhabditis tropicalis TaxID=1561998 RepID=A0A1I7T5M1_9PELO
MNERRCCVFTSPHSIHITMKFVAQSTKICIFHPSHTFRPIFKYLQIITHEERREGGGVRRCLLLLQWRRGGPSFQNQI